MKKTSAKRCYYCGKPATSGEHVPPKQMFKTSNCDSLVVPSCDEHNSKKSGNDQAIVSALLIPLHTGRHRYPLEPEIEQAIDAALPSFERAKRVAVKTAFIIDPPEGLEDLPDLAHLSPSVNMMSWIRLLTAGIIFSGIGQASTSIKWGKSAVWSPDWFPTETPAPMEHAEIVQIIERNQKIHEELSKQTWQNGWSADPKPYPNIIYSFQVCILPNKLLIIRHKFYNRYTWYVQARVTNASIVKLQKKLMASQ